MKEITAIKALELINNFSLVHIIWYSTKCPVCEHFIPQLEEAEEELTNWRFYKINSEEHKKLTKQLTWEPTSFPTSYLFVKGQRTFVAVGAAPIDAIIETHQQIEEGTWKTPENIEQEQLDALDEQE